MINRSWLDRSRGSLGLFIVMALVLGLVGLAAAELPPGGTFLDDDGNIHEGNIEAIAAEGITRGCNPPTNDRFCPSSRVTRGEMAAFLVRALGLTERLDDPFTDDDGSVFEADIEKLAAAGVTRGCNPPDNDQFCPNEHVTRGQMAAFLVRAMGYTDDGGGDLFIDDDDSVFEADIDRLGTAGVTKGCNPPTNDRFCPRDYVLRDQMASFLARALGLEAITPPPPTTTIPGETTTTVPGCPQAGHWTGETDQGREISFDVEHSPTCQIAAGTLHVSVRDSCWYYTTTEFAGSFPIVSDHFEVTIGSGTGTKSVWGDFASPTAASGSFNFSMMDPFEPWRTCTASGVWNANPGTTPTSSTTTTKPTTTTTSTSTTTSTTTTTIPDDFDLEAVAWSCSADIDGVGTCSGNIDTRDGINETWACAPYGSTDYPDWACEGNVDKSDGAAETWDCYSDLGYCTGDVNKDDAVPEEWGYGSEGCQFPDGWYGIGYIDPDGDLDSWDCHVVGGDELECIWDYNYSGQSWGCEFTGGDWVCTGETGRFAPIVGPVPMFDWIFDLG
jgi:hypothetical protein